MGAFPKKSPQQRRGRLSRPFFNTRVGWWGRGSVYAVTWGQRERHYCTEDTTVERTYLPKRQSASVELRKLEPVMTKRVPPDRGPSVATVTTWVNKAKQGQQRAGRRKRKRNSRAKEEMMAFAAKRNYETHLIKE